MWIISGIYFSCTDLDEIHGDHFIREQITPQGFSGLVAPGDLQSNNEIQSLELKIIAGVPHYWINGEILGEHQNRAGENQDN